MIIVGITGTIGTGKSTVVKIFRDLGAFIIDFDQLARRVVEPDKDAWKGIVNCFGSGILNNDRTINRQKLADIIFNDPSKLNKVNEIVHPEVYKEDNRIVEKRRLVDPTGMIIKDIPLLFEIDPEIAHRLVDKIVVVFASPQTQLRRLIKRGVSEVDALRRIESQISINEKIKMADFVINNDGSLEDTRQQVQKVYSQLLRLS